MYVSGVVVMCAYSTEMEVTGSSPLQSGSFLLNFRQKIARELMIEKEKEQKTKNVYYTKVDIIPKYIKK